MFSHIKVLLLIVAVSLGLVACAATQPAENISTTLMGEFTTEQVKSAIVAAGAQRKWEMKSTGEGEMIGVYRKKNHEVTVKIVYDTNSYQISYISSKNLKERVDNEGVVRLHHNYMRWIYNLDHDIQVQLLRAGQNK